MTVMRSLLVTLLLCVSLACAGCSYSTDFIIVNASDSPLLITYTIKATGNDPLTAVGPPGVSSVLELSERNWRPLTATQYSYDRSSRTVSVSLLSYEGLRIARGGEWHSNETMPSGFLIEKIKLVGTSGVVELEGYKLNESFHVVPQPFYSFGPPTQLVLTYE